MSRHSKESRREAHEAATTKKEQLYNLILASARLYGHCDPLTMSRKTGYPVTSLRPRFTELASIDYCRNRFNTRPKLKHIGRIEVEGASCRVTSFAINEPKVKEEGRRCRDCGGWGTYPDGTLCRSCYGDGASHYYGGRDGLD